MEAHSQSSHASLKIVPSVAVFVDRNLRARASERERATCMERKESRGLRHAAFVCQFATSP